MELIALAALDSAAKRAQTTAATIAHAPGFQLWVVLVTAAIFLAAATVLLSAARR